MEVLEFVCYDKLAVHLLIGVVLLPVFCNVKMALWLSVPLPTTLKLALEPTGLAMIKLLLTLT